MQLSFIELQNLGLRQIKLNYDMTHEISRFESLVRGLTHISIMCSD